MKRLMLAIALVCFASFAHAATVELNFAWDANTETDLDLYTLHRGTTSGGPYTAVLDIDAPAISTAYNLTGNYGQSLIRVIRGERSWKQRPRSTPSGGCGWIRMSSSGLNRTVSITQAAGRRRCGPYATSPTALSGPG